MHLHPAARREHLVRKLVLPISGLMVVVAGLLLGIAIYGGNMMNRTALESQRNLIDNALDARVVRALAEIKSVAWWDDAVINAADARKNADWLDIELGAYITESYAHDRVIVLDEHDRPVFAYADGAQADANGSITDISGLGRLVSEARGGLKTARDRRDTNFASPADNKAQLIDWKYGRWASGITTVSGHPAIVSVMTITPSVDPALLRPEPRLLVTIVRIDKALVEELGRVALLPDLSFGQGDDHRSGEYAILDDHGRPLGDLRWRAKQPGNLLLHTVVPAISVGLLAAALAMAILLIRLIRSTVALAEREAEARHLAGHDALTGLPNRRRFEAELKNLGTLSCVTTIPAVACIDLDRFKDINDTLGHQAGDTLIREVARRLSSLLRDDDLLMRPGGDELAILRMCRDRGDADLLGALVSACFAAPFPVAGQQIETSASAGLAIAEPGQDATDLLRKADIALYVAKDRGRACCVVFEPEMGRQVEARRALEVDLKRALAEGELSLAYQPIVDAVSGRLTGVEALARWRTPDGRQIAPDIFIATAEETGLMGELGRFVIDRAFSDARSWPNLDTAINVSAAQLRSVSLPRELKAAAKRYGIDPMNITLEITETVLLANDSRTLNRMNSLRRSGFRIALDDFGTGYSSLSYLRDYPFDKLKIDRSFVSGVTESGQSLSIIESVVALGRGLGLEIVAEGVETEAEMALMQKSGCTHLQGYFFSRPVSAKTIEGFAETLGSGVADQASGIKALA